MATATPNAASNQSRWGYHSCDYQQFQQLKHYHKLAARAYHDSCKYSRWANKTVHRHSVAPACPVDWQQRSSSRTRYMLVLHQYQLARRPHETQEQAQPLRLPKDWQQQFQQLQQYYDRSSS